jgi:hypothetical protein
MSHMATLNIQDSVYHRLAQRAAARHTSVEEYLKQLLEKLAEMPPAQEDAPEHTASERGKAFQELLSMVRENAQRFPPGFIVDDSRESIYRGRGE